MAKRKRSKSEQRRARLTAEEREKFVKERERLVGALISQEGWEGALVVEHIKGSQYLVRLSSGKLVYASHKKQRDKTTPRGYSEGGWKLWEDR